MSKKFPFVNLAKKSIAIISASLTTLMNHDVKSEPLKTISDENNNLNYESSKKIPQAKLVLKLNMKTPENSFEAKHVSHSSHRSHSSHSSGGSAPSNYTPTNKSSPSNNTQSKQNISTPSTLGSRVLEYGSQGKDVEELQQLLLNLDYDVTVNGHFGDKTEIAVKKFQTANNLTADGKVDSKTLIALKSK